MLEHLDTTGAFAAPARMKSAHKQIFRALLTLSSAALLVRVFGMLNQIVVSARLGAGAAMDTYFVASALPLMLALLISNVIETSVIPVYARVRTQGKEQASVLFSTSLNLLLIGAVLLTVVILALRYQMIHLTAPALDPFRTGLAVSLAPFIFPVLILMIVISFMECILNTEGQFGWPAYAGLLVPFTTAALVLALGSSRGVVMLCIGMLVGLCLQLCMVIVRARRAGIVYRLILDMRHPEIGAILITAWPVLLGASVIQTSPLVDQIFASYLSAGAISAISYSLKLISVPSGVIFDSVGRAILPYLSRQTAMKDMKAFKETLRLYLWAVGIATSVLAAFMFLLAHPLVRILFQHGAFSAEDTDRVATTLVGFVVGLTPMAFGFIVSRAFSALGRTKVLMGVSLFSVIANAVFDFIFARLWQSTGIALATSAVYFCTMFILLFILRRSIGKLDFLTPPPELLHMIGKLVTGASYSIPSGLRRRIVRGGIVIATFAAGIVGVFWNSLYTLRAAVGVLIVLAFLRYRYVLLIAWVMVDVFIGSTLAFFNGINLNTGLTLPTLLLMTLLPITQSFKRMPALALLLLYLVWAFAGIGISPIGAGPFLTEWTLILDCVAVGVLTISVLTNRQHLLKLIDALLLPATFVSLYGIYGYFTRQNGVVDPTTSQFRIFSIFSAAPALALFLSIMLPPALYRASTLRGFKRLGVSALVLVILAAMVLSFTRAALLCIPLSIVTMILFLPSRKAKIALLAGSLALAAAVFLLPMVGGISIFGRFFNQDLVTLNGRTELWQAVFSHFDPTHLLGYGMGASDALLARLRVGYVGVIATSSSNLFVAALYDGGVIGVTLLTLMFAGLGVGLLAGMRKASGERRVLFVMALVVLVNTVVQSLDQNDFWDQSIGIYFWIVMALPFALCWSAAHRPPGSAQGALAEAAAPGVETVQRAKQEQVSGEDER